MRIDKLTILSMEIKLNVYVITGCASVFFFQSHVPEKLEIIILDQTKKKVNT